MKLDFPFKISNLDSIRRNLLFCNEIFNFGTDFRVPSTEELEKGLVDEVKDVWNVKKNIQLQVRPMVLIRFYELSIIVLICFNMLKLWVYVIDVILIIFAWFYCQILQKLKKEDISKFRIVFYIPLKNIKNCPKQISSPFPPPS